MKKRLPLALSFTALGLCTFATSYLRVEKKDGKFFEFEVDDVEQVVVDDKKLSTEIKDSTIIDNRHAIVSFYNSDSSLIMKQAVVFGGAANVKDIRVPSKIGYSFVGWSAPTDNVTTDISVYTQYDKNFYIVSFYSYYKELIERQDVGYLESASLVEAPELEGHTFIGWSESTDSIRYNTNVYAMYKRNKYNVSFYDSDSTLLDVQEVYYGDYVYWDAPQKDGFHFVGWSDTLSPITSDKSLYAIYEKIIYKVSFYTIDSVLIENQYVEYGQSATLIDAPNVSGYEFKGWSIPVDTVYSNLRVFALYDKINSHEYVDLGLSVKWAKCNVGAENPEQTGYYFSWAETQPKTYFNKYNYLYYTPSHEETVNNSDGFSETITIPESYTFIGESISNTEYDAAKSNWGDEWRMPTRYEFNELLWNCTWTWGKMNETSGYKVTGKNGNWIFMPADYYWTSNCYTWLNDIGYYYSAEKSEALNITSSSHGLREHYNYEGLRIRPVYAKKHYVSFFTEDSVFIEKKEVCDGLSTTIDPPSKEGYYFTGWSESTINVTEDLSVYPTYERYNVISYYTEDGELFETEYVRRGEWPSYNYDKGQKVPIDGPKKDNYTFVQWSEALYDSITSDISVYPKYVEGSVAYVDLGLSVDWATQLVSQYYEYIFSWACLTPGHHDCMYESLDRYPYLNFDYDDYYWEIDPLIPDISGNSYYDAAYRLSGGVFSMPTEEEWKELFEKCTITKNNFGYKVKGSNGNFIVIPEATYWTSNSSGRDAYAAFISDLSVKVTSRCSDNVILPVKRK